LSYRFIVVISKLSVGFPEQHNSITAAEHATKC